QPENAVVKAQALVTTVMKDRGYPLESHDQMLADLSVEHAGTLEQYRLAHTISQSVAQGQASTEDLRQAMIKYRALFSDLLGGARAPEGGWRPGAGRARGGGPPAGVAPEGARAAPPAEPRTAGGTGPTPEVSAMDAASARPYPAGTDPAGPYSAGTDPAGPY